MTDFIAVADRGLLERHGLSDFESLWDVQLDDVDEPCAVRGGWSCVYRLELEGSGFYLKRQSNYLTRTLRRPFGEPSCSREFRTINRYQTLGIPALHAVYYGERYVDGDLRAILLTHAPDNWTDLESLVQQWSALSAHQRLAILQACGQLARTLHAAGQVCGRFYPQHVFLRQRSGAYLAQMIDLEKTRPSLFGWRDRIKDLEPLVRGAPAWTEVEVRELLATYLQAPTDSVPVDTWWLRLAKRTRYKEVR